MSDPQACMTIIELRAENERLTAEIEKEQKETLTAKSLEAELHHMTQVANDRNREIASLQARVEELEGEVKWWRDRAETGANATHWPEFGPSGRG